jgi:hypothetical protein
MGAPLGHPKRGGRKKGTPNKVKKSVDDICAEYGFDPIRGMIELLNEPGATRDQRITLTKELAKYVHPQKRALEVSGNIDLNLVERAKQLEALPEENLIELLTSEYQKLEDK